MKILKLSKLIGIFLTFFTLGGSIALASPASAPPPVTVVVVAVPVVVETLSVVQRPLREPSSPSIVFRHGDISWLPQLATEAGWPKATWKKLGHIILRESGGCPGRIGGSKVAKDCTIIGWDGSNHRSDSGLLQINYLNYDSKRIGRPAFLCKKMGVCSQPPLLDAVTNLKAGKALYDLMGWSPWRANPTKRTKP